MSQSQLQDWISLHMLGYSYVIAHLATDIMHILSQVYAIMCDDIWRTTPEHRSTIKGNPVAVAAAGKLTTISEAEIRTEVIHLDLARHHVVGIRHHAIRLAICIITHVHTHLAIAHKLVV